MHDRTSSLLLSKSFKLGKLFTQGHLYKLTLFRTDMRYCSIKKVLFGTQTNYLYYSSGDRYLENMLKNLAYLSINISMFNEQNIAKVSALSPHLRYLMP